MYSFYSARYGHDYAQTIAFSALVVIQWSSAFTARSDYESLFSRLRVFNGKFYAGLAVAVTAQMLAIFGPLGKFLHVTPVAVGDLMITGAIAFVAPILLTEAHKYIGRRFFMKGSANQKAVARAARTVATES
jgi:magnesium-transporting ATPase (P-type)